MDLGVALLADAKALEAVEPCERALDDPTVATQALARFDCAASNARRDVSQAQAHAEEAGVVRLVRVRFGWSTTGPAARSLHGRDGVDERERLVRVGDVRRRQDL